MKKLLVLITLILTLHAATVEIVCSGSCVPNDNTLCILLREGNIVLKGETIHINGLPYKTNTMGIVEVNISPGSPILVEYEGEVLFNGTSKVCGEVQSYQKSNDVPTGTALTTESLWLILILILIALILAYHILKKSKGNDLKGKKAKNRSWSQKK